MSIRPDRPFFTYLAFGAMHAPHQAPAEYLEKYRGRFDEGWDVARERWFARQIEHGPAPARHRARPAQSRGRAVGHAARATSSGWPPGSRRPSPRSSSTPTPRSAGSSTTSSASAQLDDTLIVLLSDNGASQEGGPFGVMHEMKYFNMMLETPDEAVGRIDDIGGPHSHANYPWGWAQAGNTPFKWYKQNTHEGGVHVPLIVRWPDRITDAGALRDQFHHVNDIAPTIYEVLGITAPDVYRGLEQLPITGTSMPYTFDDPDAPTEKRAQYYEMFGHRAIISDGWKAVTRHTKGGPFDDDVWELYHLDEDRSECHDLAAPIPDKLAELIALWWDEAEDQGVLPLDDRCIELFFTRYRDHSPHPSRAGTTSTTRRWRRCRPRWRPRSAVGASTWSATIDRPAGAGRRAVRHRHRELAASASSSRTTGWSSTTTASTTTRPGVRDRRCPRDRRWWPCDSGGPGPGPPPGCSSTGRPCGRADVPFAMHIISSVGPSVGYDHGSPVSERYRGHFPFEGTLHKVDIDVVRKGPPADECGRPAARRHVPAVATGAASAGRRSGGEPGRRPGIDVDHRAGDVAGALRTEEHHGRGDLVGLEPRHRLHVERCHRSGHVVAPSGARGRAASACTACRCGSCRSRCCPGR